jgi:hypothetical protein
VVATHLQETEVTTETKVEAVAARYNINYTGMPQGVHYSVDGEWVKYSAHASVVAALEGEVERLRTEASKYRHLAKLLDGFDFRLGRNELMPPATYLDSVEITCEFQPGIGQTVIDAIIDALTKETP